MFGKFGMFGMFGSGTTGRDRLECKIAMNRRNGISRQRKFSFT